MTRISLELPSTPEDVMRGVETVEAFCRERQIPQTAIHAVMLAVEEVASNIVNHAYQPDSGQTFQLTVMHEGDRLMVELRDHGPAFDPLQASAPDLETDPDERDIGGLGIHLVRHYMEQIQYHREGEENVLLMTKVIPPACS
jgi:serine/threonine-protein kinase RsbW